MQKRTEKHLKKNENHGRIKIDVSVLIMPVPRTMTYVFAVGKGSHKSF